MKTTTTLNNLNSDNPWSIEEPFDAMYTDIVTFANERLKTSFNSCIFPVESMEPFLDESVDSDVRQFYVLVRHSEWNLHPDKPVIGDTFTDVHGNRYKITSIDLTQDWVDIRARSAK